MAETLLNEETFNLEVRKFLKQVGVNSQREIERVVREALKSGALKGGESIRAEMVLSIPKLKFSYRIEDDIALG